MDENSQVATDSSQLFSRFSKTTFFFAAMQEKRAATDHTEALEVGAQQELVGGKEIWQYPTAL